MPIVAYRNTDYGELAIALACTLRLLLTGIGGERSGAGLTMVAAAGSMAGASLRKNNTATTITRLTPTTIPYLASLGMGDNSGVRATGRHSTIPPNRRRCRRTNQREHREHREEKRREEKTKKQQRTSQSAMFGRSVLSFFFSPFSSLCSLCSLWLK